MQVKRLFGFKTRDDIHDEARQMAISDTKEYLSSISVTNNPVIQSLIAQSIDTVQKLQSHFAKTIEEDNTAEPFALDKVLKMIPH